jgi:uncharacterized membrane protein HdeD (DUF308 family)
MLLNPLVGDEASWRRTVEQASKGWWAVLLSGAISVVVGMVILSIDWTVADLAVFVGAYLIFRGLVQMLNALLGGASWTYFLGTGALSIAAGIVVVAWPGPTLLLIAIFIGVAIVVYGILNVAGAIGNRDRAQYWWVVLVLGVVEILLGFWLLRRPGLTLAVAITASVSGRCSRASCRSSSRSRSGAYPGPLIAMSGRESDRPSLG